MHVGMGVNVRVWARPVWPGYMTDSWPEEVSQSDNRQYFSPVSVVMYATS